ncbi:membrane protein [Marivirga tractuosa]|uniref:Membrane protein n=1 Tax=Marivirga tractuosa (strain ATCC 23168 / DSM 4126 / NBRC 15989 / NCIMB 1408 / VKM B-1430 / H-43) TaxID=643867 RepID=E4TUM7_MARTH|nr:type IX secretion system membrane protein PorP/SprF [Marivirga tractuosa]ADR23120.1 putative membrane protein [Marivirga tractuosa DSM 4126]BDD16206.1 membrane protein [Marivirga tractuosa]
MRSNYLKNKSLYIIISLFLLGGTLKAQQYPIYSQYIFNGLVLNPAYAGSHVQLSASAMYRNQWVNFDGSPKTLFFSAHTSLMKERMGVGLLINDDRIGSYASQNIYGSYSFIIKTPKGKLALGFQAGVNILASDFKDLNLDDVGDNSFASFNSLKPNFGTGAYFYNKKFFAGFSVPFLLNNGYGNLNIENAISEVRSARYYYLNGGFMLPMNLEKTLYFQPSALIRGQEGAPLNFDINASFLFYDLLNVGVSYRNIDAVVSYIDFKLNESFHFSYSYDWTTSAIRNASNGTHEFMINYRVRIRDIHDNVTCPKFNHFM